MDVKLVVFGAIIFGVVGLLENWRKPVLLILTILGVFYLSRDSQAIIFPIMSLILVGITWLIIRETEREIGAYPILYGLALPIGWFFFRDSLSDLTIPLVVLIVGAGSFAGLTTLFGQLDLNERKRAALGWIAVLGLMLFILKMAFATTFLSEATRISHFQWIGISYIVLRLVGTLFEFRLDRLPPLTLTEFLIYILFPPTLLAGPIDGAERFVSDLRSLHASHVVDGTYRISIGLIKKFVIADTLALVALSPQIAGDVHNIGGAWFVAYLYAFQLFFDFAGYSDIAIGVGKLAGFDLPENFNAPYLRQNLTAFWQNWHMTLTGWFRTYVFVPFSRWLLARKYPVPNALIAQILTMTLIGFWHGVTWNFFIWGLWHAVGLYLAREWTIRTRPWYFRMREKPWANRLIYLSGVLATFHYVVIGWVFFALPDPASSFDYLQKMFGL